MFNIEILILKLLINILRQPNGNLIAIKKSEKLNNIIKLVNLSIEINLLCYKMFKTIIIFVLISLSFGSSLDKESSEDGVQVY